VVWPCALIILRRLPPDSYGEPGNWIYILVFHVSRSRSSFRNCWRSDGIGSAKSAFASRAKNRFVKSSKSVNSVESLLRMHEDRVMPRLGLADRLGDGLPGELRIAERRAIEIEIKHDARKCVAFENVIPLILRRHSAGPPECRSESRGHVRDHLQRGEAVSASFPIRRGSTLRIKGANSFLPLKRLQRSRGLDRRRCGPPASCN
jgi:hypothetical protein